MLNLPNKEVILMYKKICEQCGKSYETPKKSSRFCSMNCSGFSRGVLLKRIVELDGESMTLESALRKTGVGRTTYDARIERGWSDKDAYSTPIIKGDGRCKKSEYKTYRSMISRCCNPNSNAYYRYGGRGIKVCDRWMGKHGFDNFLLDMGERPEKMSLDRIDNNKGYSPDNCRWATAREQANNTCKTIHLKIGEEEKTLSDWGDTFHIKKSTICSRLNFGWTPAEALLIPVEGFAQKGELKEDDIQFALVQWLEWKGYEFWHTPNETWTPSYASRIRAKKLGVKAGIPDLTILIPKDDDTITLYLELKKPGGKMSDKQKEWQEILTDVCGTEYRCACSLDEAISIVESVTYGLDYINSKDLIQKNNNKSGKKSKKNNIYLEKSDKNTQNDLPY